MTSDSSDEVNPTENLETRHRKLERRFERLRAAAIDLDTRLNRIENSFIFRALRAIGNVAFSLRIRLGRVLLKSPFHRVYLKVWPHSAQVDSSWIPAADPEEISAEQSREASLRWSFRPGIGVVMPVHKPRLDWLAAAVDSVRDQVYPAWELLICIDGADPAVEAMIQGYVAGDSRIRSFTLEPRAGISAALNAAGKMSSAQYLAFLDHDDLLAPSALHYVAEALQDGAEVGVYTDEDWISASGQRLRPNLKPGWSPELLLSCMYMGHLLVLPRAAIDRAGWFRSEFDGAQDYDLILRLDEVGVTFRHVSRVLYHWRTHEGSTAASAAAKPYAQQAGRSALAQSLERRGTRNATVLDGPIPHTFRIRREVLPGQGISFVIVSRTPRLVERCFASLKRTVELDHEIILIHHRTTGEDASMDSIGRRYSAMVVPYHGGFNFAAMNNLGSRHARKPVVVFLNDDVTAIHPGWAQALLTQAMRPEIGVVGAKLVYGSGAIQHAGIVVGMGQGTGHAGRGVFQSDLWRWLNLARDVAAVTGACMAMRRELFERLGGFDERFAVNYNDVDLCLRARREKYRVVIETAAMLRHDEARTRSPGTGLAERELFLDCWEDHLQDQFYSPILDLQDEAIRARRGA